MSYKRIDIKQALAMMEQSEQSGLQIVDVRDEGSFQSAHIANAVHLDSSSLTEFLEAADTDKPVLVYCYHGNMSQGAAAYLADKGFSDTYSLDGGFEAWEAILN